MIERDVAEEALPEKRDVSPVTCCRFLALFRAATHSPPTVLPLSLSTLNRPPTAVYIDTEREREEWRFACGRTHSDSTFDGPAPLLESRCCTMRPSKPHSSTSWSVK